MKRWISLAAAVLALAATPAVASASGESDSVHFGPINSGSADSGTCGNNWANDTYKRVFEASTSANPDGTFSATERFIGGHFETLAGPSPDACDPSGTPGSTVAGGIDGSFHGNFLIVVTGGSFNPAADCDPTSCGTTAGFVATVYGAAATYNVTSFGFTYHAHGPDLVQSEWRNASADQGGNGGDIRST
jgi:hypothetical protein